MKSNRNKAKASQDYQDFINDNHIMSNRLLNKICWCTVAVGPAVALPGILNIYDIEYINCFLTFYITLVVSLIHTMLYKRCRNQMINALVVMVGLEVTVVMMQIMGIDIYMTYYFVPLISLMFFETKFYCMGLSIGLVGMVIAMLCTMQDRAARYIEWGPWTWLSETLSGMIIEMVFMAIGGYFIHKIMKRMMVTAYNNMLTIQMTAEENSRDKTTGLLMKGKIGELYNTLTPALKLGGAIVVMDIDNLKEINDKYGHRQGDEAIVLFGKIMNGFVARRDGAMAARYGGTEFVMFLPDIKSKTRLQELADIFRSEINTEMGRTQELSMLTFSMGATMVWTEYQSFGELFRNADNALRYVKQNGKNGYHLYGSEEADASWDNEI